MPAMMRIRKLMNEYQISRNTVQKYMDMGMPYSRVGRIMYFDEAEINEWIKSFRKTHDEVQFEEDGI